MSGKKDNDKTPDRTAARSRAQAAVAAETGKRMAQRHILELGDRAVEVVSSRPGVWHLITDGRPGPVLSPDDITGMLAADRAIKSGREAKARRDREPAGAQHGMTARQADGITDALDQGDREAAAIMLELSGPLGLSATEMERLVPDRAPGTCLSCRLPLSPRDGTEKCAWCLALHNLQARPGPVPAVPATPWRCHCGCPTERAHQGHLAGQVLLPRPGAVAVLRPLLAAGCCYWAAWHWPFPFSSLAVVLTVVLFLSFISRVVRRAVR